MKRVLGALLVFLGLTGAAQAQVTPYVGQIMTFAGNFCPTGWFLTNGQLLPIQQYVVLFSIIGTTYGGNGTTDFALPKTQPDFTTTRVPLTQCIAYLGVYPSQN